MFIRCLLAGVGLRLRGIKRDLVTDVKPVSVSHYLDIDFFQQGWMVAFNQCACCDLATCKKKIFHIIWNNVLSELNISSDKKPLGFCPLY